MSDTAPVNEPPPAPSPPPRPAFPARRRFALGGVALGLLALIVVLLTLPADEHPTRGVPPQPAPLPVIPPPAPAAVLPPPLPAPPGAGAVGAASAPTKAATSLTVRALPRGAVLHVDGRVVARRHLVVTPGRHVLQAALVGFAPVRDSVLIDPGQDFSWSPTLTPLSAARPPATRPPKPDVRPVPVAPSRRTNPDEATCQQQVAASAWTAAYQPCVRAARAGSAASARAVGFLFQRGDGVRRSDDSAAAWFTTAARAGDPEAMYQLGGVYERGRGMHKDPAAALEWYTRAAGAGNREAQYLVGEAYEKGRLGASKDQGKALQWYRKAAAQGQKDAATKLRSIGP